VLSGPDEEIVEAGQAYHLAPGHNAIVEEDAELVEVTPWRPSAGSSTSRTHGPGPERTEVGWRPPGLPPAPGNDLWRPGTRAVPLEIFKLPG
jgi:hypothetical protein